jgi:hypothetical protein
VTTKTQQYIRSNLGSSNAEIIATLTALAAAKVTVAPVALDQLGPYLRKLGVMSALKAIVADAQTDAAIRAGIADFLDQLADQRQRNLDTTDAVIAGRAAAVLSALVGGGIMQEADTAAIFAMGGGLAYAVPDDAAIDAERAAVARAATALELIGTVQAWERQQIDAAALKVTQIEAWRDTGAGEQPSVEGM